MPNPIHCRVAVIWIDWYAYHVARFVGLASTPTLAGQVVGIELVGGVGVHDGLKFRETLPSDLPIETLMPQASWRETNKRQLARLLWRRLSQLNPEVVLVPGYYTLPALAAAAWAKLHGRTCVLMTESTAADHVRSWSKEKIKGLLIRSLFDWAVTGGKQHVAYLRQLGFPAEHISSSYDVVDNEMFHQGTWNLRLNTSAALYDLPSNYFLYVGRLAQEKNVKGLLKSWLAYRLEGGTWPLILVGDGPERRALETIAVHSAYADDVLFPGLRTSHELLPFYAFAGCFILPSMREPWGLVVNEAMASSLPVLVADHCGCAADLVDDGRNGFTFNPENRVALTRHLHTIQGLDAFSRRRMGEASAEIIRGFTPAKFGLAIASIADGSPNHITMHPVRGGNQ
jgi:1,2-diacylglycerol 3-alpha-glucosyltransferase